jgi:hypothetical protein
MAEGFQDCITVARSELARARQLLTCEISDYPTPISGCDAQFNHLLGERQKVLSAIAALDDAVFVPTPRTPTPLAGVESR